MLLDTRSNSLYCKNIPTTSSNLLTGKTDSESKTKFKELTMMKNTRWAYMRGNEIGNEIEAKTPPNGAKDVSSNLLHSSH